MEMNAVVGITALLLPVIAAWLAAKFPLAFPMILGVLMVYAAGASFFLAPLLGWTWAPLLSSAGLLIIVGAAIVDHFDKKSRRLERDLQLLPDRIAASIVEALAEAPHAVSSAPADHDGRGAGGALDTPAPRRRAAIGQ